MKPSSSTTWTAVVPTVAAAVLLGLADGAPAQLSPSGAEFQVNTYTTGNQGGIPAVSFDSQGNFVIVWASDGSGGSDSSNYSIQAQRYASNGTPLGGQFQVNTYTTNWQATPSVAMDAAGDFVVVWDSVGSPGSDSSYESIQAQRFAANGAVLGGQFQVNSYTTGTQATPQVASDSAGNFVVVWASSEAGGPDTDGFSIQAQRYAANGSPLGGQFEVNAYTTGEQFRGSVAMNAAGAFVVAWDSHGSPDTDSSSYSVQAQRYAANGAAQGGQFQVNTYTTGTQYDASVAMDSAGDFVIAWASNGSAGSDLAGYSVHGQRYAASGTALGGNFQVNTYTTGNQIHASVSSDSGGDFVIAWTSAGSAGSDTSGYSIHGQRYRADGSALGGNFEANTYTTSEQFDPAVGLDSLGNFVVAWQSQGSFGSDSGDLSIQAQRYDGLFRDGFETDDTSRWSVVVP